LSKKWVGKENPYPVIIQGIYPGQGGGKKGKKSYSSRTLKELQVTAKKRGVVYSGLNKADLIEKLRKGKK